MADRRINEKYRKPRRTKGTPFYVERNYYAAGVLAFGAIAWYLYELWPQSQKLKRAQFEGKFDYPESYKERVNSIHASLGNPHLEGLLAKVRENKVR